MSVQVLPLAFTMVAGPQILTAILFVTHPRAVGTSLSFLAGAAVATVLGTTIAYLLAGALGNLGRAGDAGSTGTIVQLVLAALLAGLAIRIYLNRETVKPPKWLAGLLEATPRKAFAVGFLLFIAMPTDVVAMFTVGTNVKQNDNRLVAATPFWALTLLLVALPVVAYAVFGRRAREAMPKVRDFMTDKSWLVNIVVLGLFVFLILF